MKDYQKFSVNDFAMDEYFQSWVLHSNDAEEAFWRAFQESHPEKCLAIEEARDILINFRLPRYSLSESEVSTLWQNIKRESLTSKEKRFEGYLFKFKWKSIGSNSAKTNLWEQCN